MFRRGGWVSMKCSRVWRGCSSGRRRADGRGHILTGLLAPVERNNSWQLSEAAGEVRPARLQHFLNRSRWDADELRDRLRTYVGEALGCPDGVLVPDETYERGGRQLQVGLFLTLLVDDASTVVPARVLGNQRECGLRPFSEFEAGLAAWFGDQRG